MPPARFNVGRDEDSEDSWDRNHEVRYNRIRNRVPTGHPQMAKQLLQKLDMDSGSDSEPEPQRPTKKSTNKCECNELRAELSQAHDEIANLEMKLNDYKRKLKKYYKALQDADGRRPEEVSPTKDRSDKSSSKKDSSSKKRVVVAAADSADEDDIDWDRRHADRYTRIRNRVPTGHPGMATKVNTDE